MLNWKQPEPFQSKLNTQLTNLIQLESFVLNFFLVEKPLDLRTERARGLGEHHDLVVLDVLIHHLDGRPGDRSHVACLGDAGVKSSSYIIKLI